jgi:hypothetical protein
MREIIEGKKRSLNDIKDSICFFRLSVLIGSLPIKPQKCPEISFDNYVTHFTSDVLQI